MHLNNEVPGSKYTESGKLVLLPFLLFLVIGYLLSALLGVGYGLLSDLNPFIYLNFILLGVSVLIVVFAINLFKTVGKLRNRYVSMLLAAFFGFVCIYNAWSAIYAGSGQSVFGGLYFQHSFSELTEIVSLRNLSIGRLGRNGDGLGSEITSLIYAVEFLILVIAPAWFAVKDPSYYCEDCDKAMQESEHYFGFTDEQSEAIQTQVKAGKLKELHSFTSYPDKSLNLSLKYIHYTDHQCPECNKLVYSAVLGTAKMDKENTEFKKQHPLAVTLFGSTND